MPAPGRRALVVATLMGLLLTLGWATAPGALAATDAPDSGVTEQALTVPVRAEPDGTAVTLDASVFAPATAGPHPAVLLAHGFGGSKTDLVDRARDFAGRGYVVLTYSARGFGASGGRIHLDDPDFEVADARALVDLLATRPDVRLDGPGDPRVGVAGGSYGGALALMLGATDKRVDTVVASITWNDLAEAFFPQHVTTDDSPASPADLEPIATPGPFKQLWASTFFQAANSAPGPGPVAAPPRRYAGGSTPRCAGCSSRRPSRVRRAPSSSACCGRTARDPS